MLFSFCLSIYLDDTYLCESLLWFLPPDYIRTDARSDFSNRNLAILLLCLKCFAGYAHVHSSIICNNYKMEKMWISIIIWANKWNVVYLYNGILFNFKNIKILIHSITWTNLETMVLNESVAKGQHCVSPCRWGTGVWKQVYSERQRIEVTRDWGVAEWGVLFNEYRAAAKVFGNW
jgi:hypothetical protein